MTVMRSPGTPGDGVANAIILMGFLCTLAPMRVAAVQILRLDQPGEIKRALL